jgi:alkylated DNA repair protein alkB family protein 6
MAAIDFMALLKEEKAKQKQKQSTCVEAEEAEEISQQASQSKSEELVFKELQLSTWPRIDLSSYVISSIAGISYIPALVSKEESRSIVELVLSVPTANPRWVHLRGRSLQCWGGQATELTTDTSNSKFIRESLPQYLQAICKRLVESSIFPSDAAPNHVLINRYARGEGIMAHTDGPAYTPRTATLSLSLERDGGEIENESEHGAVLTFQRRVRSEEVGTARQCPPECEVVLRPRSLIVFSDDAYIEYMHAINDITRDRGDEGGTTACVDAGSSSHQRMGSAATMGIFDVAGSHAVVANTDAAAVAPGDHVNRPSVRVSLTFRHVPC